MNDSRNLLEFPCAFPLKVFGRNEDQFELYVLDLVQKHVPRVDIEGITSRPSRDGKYVSVTVMLFPENKNQLDAIYMDLRSSQRILMAL